MATPLVDTSTTAKFYGALRNRLLPYVPTAPLDTTTLAARGFEIYSGGWAPDVTPYPYGLGRLINFQSSTFGFRLAGDYELLCYHRPRANMKLIEDIADVIDQAMKQFTSRDMNGSRGLAFSRERIRDTLPPFNNPADREVVGIRFLFSLVVYPRFLTVLGTGLPTA